LSATRSLAGCRPAREPDILADRRTDRQTYALVTILRHRSCGRSNYGKLSVVCRMFGSTGTCAGCGQNIPPSEMVLRACTGVYHVQCFSCASCHCRLVAGDKYRVLNGHIICGDHELPPQPLSALQAGKQQHAAMAVQISSSPAAAAAGRLAAPAVPTASTGASHGARSRQKVSGDSTTSRLGFDLTPGFTRAQPLGGLDPPPKKKKLDGSPQLFMKLQTAVHETGYTIRILLCTII